MFFPEIASPSFQLPASVDTILFEARKASTVRVHTLLPRYSIGEVRPLHQGTRSPEMEGTEARLTANLYQLPPTTITVVYLIKQFPYLRV